MLRPSLVYIEIGLEEKRDINYLKLSRDARVDLLLSALHWIYVMMVYFNDVGLFCMEDERILMSEIWGIATSRASRGH
ncbi:hypothetical protein SUGI_0572310 [Cryptomeria japonica]|nr:hypothetical protein SUGI_0572310 [Cryptomeria japonica]